MKIALVGDTALFGRFDLENNPNVLAELERVQNHLKSHDIIVANLETPLCNERRPVGPKSAHIRSPVSNIKVLEYLGITHVSLANNHMGDFGHAGYDDTKRVLDEAGIVWFGCEGRQALVEEAGARVALEGYCAYNTNPLMIATKHKSGVNPLDLERLVEDMTRNANDGYMSIISVHSGQEHVPLPSLSDIRLARGLAKKFQYVYFGHHPHVIQGIEVVNSSPIFYSLGNFLFDDVFTPRDKINPLIKLSEANKTGLIVTLEVRGNEVTDWSTTTTYLGTERVSVDTEVPPIPQDEYNSHLTNAEDGTYTQRRNELIQERIGDRKKLRNLSWYIQRCNWNSVGMLLRMYFNAKKQTTLVTSKLNKLG